MCKEPGLQAIAVALDAAAEDRGGRLEGLGWAVRLVAPGGEGLEVLQPLLGDLPVDERLDVGQVLALLGSDKGDGNAVSAQPAGPANAMDVVLGVFRDVVVDHVRDI